MLAGLVETVINSILIGYAFDKQHEIICRKAAPSYLVILSVYLYRDAYFRGALHLSLCPVGFNERH